MHRSARASWTVRRNGPLRNGTVTGGAGGGCMPGAPRSRRAHAPPPVPSRRHLGPPHSHGRCLQRIAHRLERRCGRRGTATPEAADPQAGERGRGRRRRSATPPGRRDSRLRRGGFVAARGLRPFRLGAFQAAVATGAPVVPIALRGTREVLRAGARVPRPGRVHVWVGEPRMPNGNDWRAVVDLRDRTVEAIARHCGEPVRAASAISGAAARAGFPGAEPRCWVAARDENVRSSSSPRHAPRPEH